MSCVPVSAEKNGCFESANISNNDDFIHEVEVKDGIQMTPLNKGREFNHVDSDSDLDQYADDYSPTADDFVEFHFNPKNNMSNKELVDVIDRDFGSISQVNLEVQEPDRYSDSKRRLTASPNRFSKPREINIEDDEDSDEEWKEIDTQLNCGDIYNAKGEEIEYFKHSKDDITELNSAKQVPDNSTKQHGTSKKFAQAATGFKFVNDTKQQKLKEKYQRAHLAGNDKSKQGYTRIDEEGQAKKFGEMDKKFDFLFQNDNSNLRKLQNINSSASNSKNDINNSTESFINNDNFEEIFSNEGHDENELNPSLQMMSTKSMLNDSQKMAYVSLVKLIIVEMQLQLINVRGSGSTKILKRLSHSHSSFTRWSMNIMNSLYDHLEIKKEAEIKMIETLSCHGVKSSDLTRTFVSNVSVQNHLNDDRNEKQDLKIIDLNKDEIEDSKTITIDIKWTLICDLFLILLESSIYDARSRTLLLNFANQISISNLEIYQFERRITDSLEIDEAFEIMHNNQTWDESDILKEHKKKQRNKKIVKVALATAAGGLVIGLSAGALAPVIGAGVAAGLTTIGISGTSGFLAGAGGTAIITTGGVMSGMRAGQNAMQNRSGSVKTFEFIPLHNNRRVNLIITVSGWMSGSLDDVRLPFSTVDQVMGDLYSLLWEPDMLTSMGQTIKILANEILTQSIQQILGVTLLTTLMAGLQLPMMLSKIGYLLDNPWNNSLDRAWKSGKVLADTLRRNKLGVRPITLVGFSLGARLIYSCLLDLAKSKDFGIVENVYLFGSPIVINDDEIVLARSVVSGRFVNGYVKQDWILGYLFRATSGGLRSIAGLSPIDEERFNIENFNCSDFVKGHMQYREAMPKLLRYLEWEVLDDKFIEIEQPNPEEEERQRKLLSDFEKAQYSKKKKTWYNKWFGKNNKEWWEMYEEGQKDQKEKQKGSKKGLDGEHSEQTTDDPELFNVPALKKEIEKMENEVQKNYEKTHDVELTKLDLTTSENNELPNKLRKFHISSNKEPVTETSLDTIDSPIQYDVNKSFKIKSESLISKPHEKTPDGGKASQVNSSLNQALSFISKPADAIKTPSHSRNSSVNAVDTVFNVISPSHSTNPSSHRNPKETIAVQETPKIVCNSNKPHTMVMDKLKNIDYGDYIESNGLNNGKKTGIHITFDDELDAIENEIISEQHHKPGYGPNTAVDYEDDDEFPQDESRLQISFE